MQYTVDSHRSHGIERRSTTRELLVWFWGSKENHSGLEENMGLLRYSIFCLTKVLPPKAFEAKQLCLARSKEKDR